MTFIEGWAVITGGAQGIGLSVARQLAQAGVPLVLLDQNAAQLEQARATLAAEGARVETRVLDVRDAVASQACARSIEAELGPVGSLVTCAGTTRSSPAASMSLQDWSLVLDINLTGTFLSAQAFAQGMLQRGRGAIVTISSTTGIGGQAGRANYAASKWGVIGLSKTLAIEWGHRGVRVNALAPGPVNTELYARVPEAFRQGIIADRIPLGRAAETPEIANGVLFLLSEQASYVNGTVLAVDGGFSSGFATHHSGADLAT